MGTVVEHQGEPPSSLHEALWLSEDWRDRELSSVERLTRMARQALPGSSDARGCSSHAAQAECAAADLGRLIGLLQRAMTEQATPPRTSVNPVALEELVRTSMGAGIACFSERAAQGQLDLTLSPGDSLGDFPGEFIDIRRGLVDALTEQAHR